MTIKDIEDIDSKFNILEKIKKWIKPANTFSLKYNENFYFIIDKNKTTLNDLIDEITWLLEKNPSNTIDLRYIGKIYFIMGRYEEALEDLTKLLKIEQDNIIVLRYQGEINYIMKRYEESIAVLKKLLKIKPDDAWAKEALKLVEGL